MSGSRYTSVTIALKRQIARQCGGRSAVGSSTRSGNAESYPNSCLPCACQRKKIYRSQNLREGNLQGSPQGSRSQEYCRIGMSLSRIRLLSGDFCGSELFKCFWLECIYMRRDGALALGFFRMRVPSTTPSIIHCGGVTSAHARR